VARLERLSKSLDRPIVTSGDFARLVGGEVECLGAHELRGMATPIEVHTPKEFA
jgi:hypothetical protein